MHLRNKFLSVLVIICLSFVILFADKISAFQMLDGENGLTFFNNKETIYFWYTDDSLTDYIYSAAVSFGERENVRVIPELVSASEYLDAINEASLRSERIPDAYLVYNDSLEKAYLAGLADEISDTNSVINTDHFPQSAISAVTYQDKKIAYPLFFETSVLVYNETYLKEWASQQAKKGEQVEGEEGVTDATAEVETVELTEEELQIKTDEWFAKAIPSNIDAMLDIADTFDPPEAVEGIFKWDVSDILYNYYFVGNYMIIGGETGDDRTNISINNAETIQSLEIYQSLNQFFYIESGSVTYDSVIQDFIDGKVVFTIGTTDVLKRLEAAKADGSMAYDYGVSVIPGPSETLQGRSLSVTSAIAVNGYSEHTELANKFAVYLADEYYDSLYEWTGRVSSNLEANQDNEQLQVFMEAYEKSVSLPKIIEASNFWIQLEVLFSKIWNGEDVAALVQDLSDQILTQTQ